MQKHYLSPEEEAAILSMREEGNKMETIARKFGICQATVSNVINGKHKVRGKQNRRRGCGPRRPERELVTEEAEQVFVDLPDDVLFQHVRLWDYIG